MISRSFLAALSGAFVLADAVGAQTPPAAAPAPAAPPKKAAPPFREDFPKLKAGELVPDVVVQNAAGEPAKLSDYTAGKITVISIWGAAAGLPAPLHEHWERLAQKYRGQGVAFLGIGSYGTRADFDTWREKNAGKYSFAVAFDPLGKYPAAAKTRQEMTPEEVKAETDRYRAFFAQSLSTQISGVLVPYPTTIVVDAQRRLVGWFSGTQPTYQTALANLLLRAGVTLDAADRPERVYTREETAPPSPVAAPVARTELLPVGAVAPDFTVQDLDGRPVKLSDFRGKVVVLDFWATWCGPCIASMPHTNDVGARYQDQGVVVFGSCTSDTRAAFEKWVRANRAKYPNFVFAHDAAERSPAGISLKLYGVAGIPQQFVIDREGRVAARVTGYLPGEVLLDAALAKAGIKVDPAIIAQAAIDQQKRDASK
jgi:peroxiredoxin